jgi:hypothetical protein
VTRHVDDDHPHHLPELRRREPDAVPERVHRVDEIRRHARDLLLVVRAELPRRLLEGGVRVAEDLSDQWVSS